MVRAILLDIGGVLIGLNLSGCIHAFRSILGFERITELLDPCHQKGIYGDLEAGVLTPGHFRELILAESRPGCVPADIDRAMEALLVKEMDPRTVAAVLDLRTRYPLYLVSNNNPISMGHIREVFRQNGLGPGTFRGEFISSEMMLSKPSEAFYREVVQRVGLPAGELLFVDDNAANVEGARAVGMEARLFVPGADLGALLADC